MGDPVLCAGWYIQKYGQLLSDLASRRKWEVGSWREISTATPDARRGPKMLAGQKVAQEILKGEGNPLSDLCLLRTDERAMDLLEMQGIGIRPETTNRLSPSYVR